MKKVVIGLILWIALLFSGCSYITSSLDALVKDLVQEIGSEMTQTEVVLQDVKIDAAEGKASMFGLTVDNPAGYKEQLALSFDGIFFKMDPETITSDVILINEIVVATPVVIVEVKNDGDTNVEVLQKNVESFIKKLKREIADVIGEVADSAESNPGEGIQSTAAKSSKVIIEDFYIRNVNANLNVALLGEETFSLSVPDIHLQDIGKKESGVLLSEAIAQIIGAFLDDLKAVVLDSDEMKALDQIGKKIDTAAGKISIETNKLVKEIEETTDVKTLGDDVMKESDKLINSFINN